MAGTCRPEDDLRAYRKALGNFSTGVAVVAAAHDDAPIGMTINSFGSVSLEPACILWNIGEDAACFDAFCQVKRFAMHVLTANQQAIAERFADSTEGKFSSVDWRYDDDGVPVISGCLARFQCRSSGLQCIGDHRIIFGAVQHYSLAQGSPLVFAQGQYRRLQKV